MHSNVDQRVSAALVGLLTALAAGCSDEGTSKLKIETANPPVYLAAKDHGSSEWRTFPTEGLTSFEIEVAEAHEVVIVCRDVDPRDGTITVGLSGYLRTRDDGDTLRPPCAGDSTSEGRVAVKAFVPGANYVLFGPNSRTSSRVGVNVDTRVRPGTYDLLAVNGAPPTTPLTAALRRDIQISGDVDLGTVDLTQAMRPLVVKTFSVSNALPEEELNGYFELRTAGIAALSFDVDGKGPMVSFLPDELLLPSDKQLVSISARRPATPALPQSVTRQRYVDPKSDAAIELPEAPGPITFERTETRASATWTTRPQSEHLLLLLSTPGGDRVWSTGLFMSRSFVEATDASSIALDTAALPEFQSEWNHPVERDPLFWLTTYDGQLNLLGGDPSGSSVTIQPRVPD